MKKLFLTLIVLFAIMISGCGPAPTQSSQNSQPTGLNRVEGILTEIEYNGSDTKFYRIQDSYGKIVTIKSGNSNVANIMRIGDKVEVYFDNDFYPKKITVKQNLMK